LNGTGAETLRDDALAQRTAIEDALDVMRKAEFNARDYYPVEGAWAAAVAERTKLVMAMKDASEHFMAVAEMAQARLDERAARMEGV
jgi:hypothetical protein